MLVREHKAGDYLKTPEAIAAYLNVVFEDPDTDHEDLMIALRNVADAIGGVRNWRAELIEVAEEE